MDIDGVLNPFLSFDLAEKGFVHVVEGWHSASLDLVNHKLWLHDLYDRADLVWGSSWLQDSNSLIKHYELPSDLDYVSLNFKGNDPDVTWKLSSVRSFASRRSSDVIPVVWIDDEIKQDALDWAKARGNTMIVVTDPSVGWTKEQYQAILKFIADHG